MFGGGGGNLWPRRAKGASARTRGNYHRLQPERSEKIAVPRNHAKNHPRRTNKRKMAPATSERDDLFAVLAEINLFLRRKILLCIYLKIGPCKWRTLSCFNAVMQRARAQMPPAAAATAAGN